MTFKITEKNFYKYMENMNNYSSYNEVKKIWYKCFHYMMRNIGLNNNSITILFFKFEMWNWTALHISNTEYSGLSKEKLKECFDGECSYICDRYSLDRIFRVHWLFRMAYESEVFSEEAKNFWME